jgi:hypothetical protein
MADLPVLGGSIDNGKSNGQLSVTNGKTNGRHVENIECRDFAGNQIQNAMHFVPSGPDICKLCVCENGLAKVRDLNVFSNKDYENFFLAELSSRSVLPSCRL